MSRTDCASEWIGTLCPPAWLIHIAAARARNSMGYVDLLPTPSPSVMRSSVMGFVFQSVDESLMMTLAEACLFSDSVRNMVVIVVSSAKESSV